jgi:hypothetical protein
MNIYRRSFPIPFGAARAAATFPSRRHHVPKARDPLPIIKSTQPMAEMGSMEARMDSMETKLLGMEKMLSTVCDFIVDPDSPTRKTTLTRRDVGSALETNRNENKQLQQKKIDTPWKTETKDKPTNFRAILREEQEKANIEAERAIRRKRNVILHKVPELESEVWADRKAHDGEIINSLLEHLELSIEVIDHHRLGARYKTAENATAQLEVTTAQLERPLLVILNREADRNLIFAHLSKLATAGTDLKSIRVSSDMSPKEREEVRSLVAKAKNQNATEGGDFRFIVKGLQIIKVRARPRRERSSNEGILRTNATLEEPTEAETDKKREMVVLGGEVKNPQVEAI